MLDLKPGVTVAVYVCLEKSDKHRVGLTVYDSESMRFVTGECLDGYHLAHVEAVLIRERPSVVVAVLEKRQRLERSLRRVCSLLSCEFTIVANPPTGAIDQEMGLLLAEGQLKNHQTRELQLHAARQSLLVAVDFCQLKQDRAVYGRCSLSPLEFDSFLNVDFAALVALNVFSGSGHDTSLFNLLNRTTTPVGARTLYEWLCQPSRDAVVIVRRQDCLEALIANSLLRRTLRSVYLTKCPNLDRIATRLHKAAFASGPKGKILALDDLEELYTFVELVASLPATVDVGPPFQSSVDELLVQPLKSALGRLQKFQQLFRHTVVRLEASTAAGSMLAINPKLDPRLREYSDHIARAETCMSRLSKEMQRIVTDHTGKQGDLVRVVTVNSRTLMRTTPAHFKVLEGAISVKATTRNRSEVLFTTDGFTLQAAAFSEARIALTDAEATHRENVFRTAATFWPAVDMLRATLGSLDVLIGLAAFIHSSPRGFVRPVLGGDSLVLEAARHPLLEVQMSSGVLQSDTSEFVSNDVRMSRGSSHLQVVTGPNSGGKSTYIRTVAICALLAHVGCFVPATTATIPLLTNIFCRIGSQDHPLLGISTFYAECIEAAAICEAVTADSLVIVDEFGRGTCVEDGSGLAVGLTRFLAEKTCFCLFATHFDALKRLEVPGVSMRHAASQITDDGLRLHFKVEDGACYESFGIDLATKLGFPDDVVQDALSLLKSEGLS